MTAALCDSYRSAVSVFEAFTEWSELVVRSPETPSTYVRLFEWARVDAHQVAFAVEAVADGLCARLDSVSISVWDGVGNLTEFLDGLAVTSEAGTGRGRGGRIGSS